MDEETYAQIPETLELREIRYNIIEPGRRTHTIDVITTLTDADEYTKEDIAQLYGFRWNSEVFHAQCEERDNLYRGGRSSYSRRIGVAEVGLLVPAAQAFRFRRKPMREVKEDVPPRARRDASNVSL